MHSYPFQQHVELFQALGNVLDAKGNNYYIIGGQARDLMLSQQNIRPISVTMDIDLAVKVYSLVQFDELKGELYANGFEATKIPYRIRWRKTNTLIDLLPFGPIASKDSVQFDKESKGLSVVGFTELLGSLEHFFLDKEQTLSVPIAPLYGIFLLKIISWSDRPEVRQKDLDDLHQILIHCWDFYEDQAYEHHFDIFDPPMNNVEEYGARILGRHLSRALSESPLLKTRVRSVLETQMRLIDPLGPMLLRFTRETWEEEKTITYYQSLLSQVLRGLHDEYPT